VKEIRTRSPGTGPYLRIMISYVVLKESVNIQITFRLAEI